MVLLLFGVQPVVGFVIVDQLLEVLLSLLFELAAQPFDERVLERVLEALLVLGTQLFDGVEGGLFTVVEED